MNHNIKLGILVALALAACSNKAPEHPAANLVVLDAAIQTMNPAQPQATALAVVDGKVAYVGDEQGAQARGSGKTRACSVRTRPPYCRD